MSESASTDNTQRFTSRVGDYVKYRPSYPEALAHDLSKVLAPGFVLADVGAGTGLFTRLVSPLVARVVALEPNDAMRNQGRADSTDFANVEWGAGSAEATGLLDRGLDGLVCAQAFHWFDRAACGREWRRILKPGAPVVLVWNERDEESSALQAEYNAMLNQWCPEYPRVNHKNVTRSDLESYFHPNPVQVLTHRNDQRFDLEGWWGRLRSASYCPPPEEEGFPRMMEGMAVLFERYRDSDGLMTFPYVTKAYIGTLTNQGVL